jgi:hypothetical protein
MKAKALPFDDEPDRSRSRAQTTLDFAVGMSVFLIAVAFVLSFTPNIIAPFAESGTEDSVTANRVASQLVEGTLADPDTPYVLDKACTVAFFAPENVDGDIDDDDLNDTNDDQLQENRAGDDDYRYDISSDPIWTGNDCNFELTYLHERFGVAGIAEDGSIDRALSPDLQIEIRGDVDDDGTTNLLCLDSNNDPNNTPQPNETADIVESSDGAFDTGDDCDASGGDYDIPFQAGGNPPENSGSVVVARRIVTIDDIRATVLVRVW